MSDSPVICFGQQPNGFFPRRFFYAKVLTARRMQAEMGGKIIFFCHDGDHDPRETRTILHHRKTGEVAQLNFEFTNKIQRKFSPLFLKRIHSAWQAKMALQLQNYVERPLIQMFESIKASNPADFCLEMYRSLGLLENVTVMRSSAPAFRRAACDIADYFVDVPYEGETVRARVSDGVLKLHEGGDSFITLPMSAYTKEQITPTRDTRLRWMQSVVNCTHYIAGAGEQAYLHQEEAPEIQFVPRDTIERSDEAYIPE
jgi:hypothetical protein